MPTPMLRSAALDWNRPMMSEFAFDSAARRRQTIAQMIKKSALINRTSITTAVKKIFRVCVRVTGNALDFLQHLLRMDHQACDFQFGQRFGRHFGRSTVSERRYQEFIACFDRNLESVLSQILAGCALPHNFHCVTLRESQSVRWGHHSITPPYHRSYRANSSETSLSRCLFKCQCARASSRRKSVGSLKWMRSTPSFGLSNRFEHAEACWRGPMFWCRTYQFVLSARCIGEADSSWSDMAGALPATQLSHRV